MSKRKIRAFSSEFKAKVALEAIKEEQTIAELAEKHGVLSRSICMWKKELLNNMSIVFDRSKDAKAYKKDLAEKDREKETLYKHIGKLTTQNEWLKKKSDEYGLKYED